MMTQDLKDAIRLLEAWTRSQWKDFIKEQPSPLMHNTKKFIESQKSQSTVDKKDTNETR